jgi:hypothetical protein
MLETLTLLPNRRLVCDVLADIGRLYVDTFASRLSHPSSNLVKDIIYIIDKVNPPTKFVLFAQTLDHPNPVLRLETLAVIGRSGTDESFDVIAKTLKSHSDPQMRAQAARLLPNFVPEKGAQMLLAMIQADTFDKIAEAERKAALSALVQLRTPLVDTFLAQIFDQKSSIFAKKRVDDMKLLAIGGLESAPSISGLQLLKAVAEDTAKKHSKDVRETAAAAVINVKARLGGGA